MKLWNEGVRLFKCSSKSKIYHFKSKTLRRNISNIGSKSGKIFLKKWGISIKFFKKYYLESNTIYEGELKGPKKNLSYFFDLLLCKVNLFFLKLFLEIKFFYILILFNALFLNIFASLIYLLTI